jgi:hypothetical protein
MATYLSDLVIGANVDINFQALTNKGQLRNVVVHKDASAPTNPVDGQLWFDSSGGTGNGALKYYDNGSWTAFGTGAGTVSTVSGGVGIDTSGTASDPIVDLDLSSLTTIGTIADADEFAVFDVGVGHRKITFGNLEAALEHDKLIGSGGNKHIDHSTVSITAGDGLTGGGDITTTRTLNVGAGQGITVAADSVGLDIQGLTADNTIATTDDIVYHNGTNHVRTDMSTLRTFMQSGINLTFDTAGDSGTGSVSTSQTFTIQGTTNQLATTASGQTLTVAFTNDVTMPNDLTVSGDLTVNGTTTTVNTDTLIVQDPLIKLGDGNSADSVDLGLYWEYDNTGAEYGGIYRDASDANKAITFFESNTTEPTTTVVGGTLADVKFGTVRAGVWQGTAINETYIDSSLPRKYAADLGAITADTPLTVTHNLGTNDVIVQVYDTTTNDMVFVDVDKNGSGVNNLTVTFANSYASGDFRIVVIG